MSADIERWCPTFLATCLVHEKDHLQQALSSKWGLSPKEECLQKVVTERQGEKELIWLLIMIEETWQ